MRILVGLGGNRGEVSGAFQGAATDLSNFCDVLACSSMYRSQAIGPDQDDFLNAVLMVDIAFHPTELLAHCLQIEAAHGRDRASEPRWGPRTLDLDLLIAESCVFESGELVLPHPRLAERRFALLPAAELVPEWLHPRCHQTLAELAGVNDPAAQPCRRVGPFLR